jgi:thiosulfate dehydrogenase [quinone] large subunit
MIDNAASRTLLVLLRLAMAWVFLYAASHQVFANWSVAGFLGSTKTFHWLFAPLAAPGWAALTFLIDFGPPADRPVAAH